MTRKQFWAFLIATFLSMGRANSSSNPVTTTTTTTHAGNDLLDNNSSIDNAEIPIPIDETALFGRHHHHPDRGLQEINGKEEREWPCELKCHNGGTCQYVPGTVDDWRLAAQTGVLVQRCVCPVGFGGTGCEIPVEKCIATTGSTTTTIASSSSSSSPVAEGRVCELSGKPCDVLPDGTYTCACHVADAVDANLAGRACRRWNTEYCAGELTVLSEEHQDEPQQRNEGHLYLCTNGGKCRSDFIAAELAPGDVSVNREYADAGCVCNAHFYGPHCEFLDFRPAHNVYMRQQQQEGNGGDGVHAGAGGDDPANKNAISNDGDGSGPGVAILLLSLGSVGILVLAVYRRRRHRTGLRRRAAVISNQRVFKDHHTNQVEFSDVSMPPGDDGPDLYMEAVTELHDISLAEEDSAQEHNASLEPPTAVMPTPRTDTIAMDDEEQDDDDDVDDAHRFA